MICNIPLYVGRQQPTETGMEWWPWEWVWPELASRTKFCRKWA